VSVIVPPAGSLDIFGRQPLSFGGAFAADAASVIFTGPPTLNEAGIGNELTGSAFNVGMIVQQISFAYQQQITRLFEVGSNLVFYVAGRSQGNASIARVLGPRPVLVSFYSTYGNVCNAAANLLTFNVSPGCNIPKDVGDAMALTLTGVVIMSVGFGVSAENMVISEQVSMMYATLFLDF
jgi:hypothetical protein